MTAPRIATSQLICLNFDGGLTSYNGELFSIEQVEVGNAGLSEHQIAQIVAKLNAEFEGQNVVFTADMPASGEYSTVFIGKTSKLPHSNRSELSRESRKPSIPETKTRTTKPSSFSKAAKRPTRSPTSFPMKPDICSEHSITAGRALHATPTQLLPSPPE